MIRIALAALAFCLILPASADARPKKRPAPPQSETFPFFNPFQQPDLFTTADGRRVRSINVRMRRVAGPAAQIVSHPSGCPRRAFCGCGASVEVFGKPVRSLFLAANWLRFPRATPAPGMVAARRGHVFVLKQHVGGSNWLAFDANSGRRQTRIHVRSIAGFTVVNPHGAG